jgi:hypothetical protein
MAFNRQTQRLGFEDWANAVSGTTQLPMDVARLVTDFLDVGKAVRPVANTRITELYVDPDVDPLDYGSCGYLLREKDPHHYDAKMEFCVESGTCRAHGRWCGLCAPSRVRCVLRLSRVEHMFTHDCLAIFAHTAYRDRHGAVCLRGPSRWYHLATGDSFSCNNVAAAFMTKDDCITFTDCGGRSRYHSHPVPQLRHALEAMACHLMSWRACRDINQNIEPSS